MPFRRRYVGLTWLLFSCAGTPAPEAVEPESAVAPMAESSVPRDLPPEFAFEPASVSEASSAAAPPASSASATTGSATSPAADPAPSGALAPRQVIYRATPESLTIDVEGLRFVPQARALQLPNGRYGVRVEVSVEARDDSSHHLLMPSGTQLSFFSRVFDKRGKLVAEHADQRQGSETQIISPGMKVELVREWPADAKDSVLWWGQSLRLEVGLWGLGRMEQDRRPLKRLFVVELKATAKPKARILAPELP